MIGQHEKIYIPLWRLEKLQSDSKELKRADALIARLRAENEVLKRERKAILSLVHGLKRHISIAGNHQKKWAVAFVSSKIAAARLI